MFRDHPEMYLNHWSDEDEMRSPPIPNPVPAPAGWPLMVPPPPHGGPAHDHHHHGAAGHHHDHVPGNVMVLAMEDDQDSDHENIQSYQLYLG